MTLVCTHRRIGWFPEKTVIAWDVADDGSWSYTVDASGRSYLPGTKDLVSQIRELGIDGYTKQRAARDALHAAGFKIQTKRLADALRWMRDETPLFPTCEQPVDKGGNQGGNHSDQANPGITPGNQNSETESPSVQHGNHVGNHRESGSEARRESTHTLISVCDSQAHPDNPPQQPSKAPTLIDAGLE